MNAIVEAVGNEDAALGIQRQAVQPVKLSRARPALPPKL
jgi:hypothetical protein